MAGELFQHCGRRRVWHCSFFKSTQELPGPLVIHVLCDVISGKLNLLSPSCGISPKLRNRRRTFKRRTTFGPSGLHSINATLIHSLSLSTSFNLGYTSGNYRRMRHGQVWRLYFHPYLFVCRWARYMKKLWTDSDNTLWTCWVCAKDYFMRFWFGFTSGLSSWSNLSRSAHEMRGVKNEVST